MKIEGSKLVLEDDDLREIFAIYTSCTKYERSQVYDETSSHHFRKIDLKKEKTETQAILDWSVDSWRAVLWLLRTKGFSLCKGDQRFDLSFIEDEFVA